MRNKEIYQPILNLKKLLIFQLGTGVFEEKDLKSNSLGINVARRVHFTATWTQLAKIQILDKLRIV